MTITEQVAIVALGINAGAIIWGAAKLSSSVDHLKDTVAEIKEIVMNVSNQVHSLIARVYILEDRAGIEYRKSDDIERKG